MKQAKVFLALFTACGFLRPIGPVRGATEELQVPGLSAAVEILRDPWGVAHIYAKSEHDLFFAQGYNVARDRLFQLELWRRLATGTMAEIQGDRALARDIGARLLRFRGDMTRELASYHPHGPEIVSAFVEGINAFIARSEQSASSLPIEFKILGIKPGRWTPEIVVSRHNGLFRNVTNEVRHAQLVHTMGADQARALLNLHPGHPRLDMDPAIDAAGISDAVIALYAASRAPLHFEPADVEPDFRRPIVPRARGNALVQPKATAGDGANEGSNNWVLSGARTGTHSPIMANDPHRAIQLPSLRYWVHLVAPGWNVIGAGEPALPGVSVGHNERGAWGFTIFPIDQEDLYVYEIDPNDTARYKYRGDWEAYRVVRETIFVKERGALEVGLKFTRHGPVLYEDRDRRSAYVLKAAWLEEGATPYLASLRIDQASSWNEFREACRYFRTPSENLVWADIDGHIGWQAVGLAPIRPKGNGLVPVPVSERYEWSGYLPAGELPYAADPARGTFASANQDNLPDKYPHLVGFEWTDPFRFARIEETLASGQSFTLNDMMKLQLDELSLPARSLVPLLRGLTPHSVPAKAAAERLLAWNFILNRDSVPAAIHAAWEKELRIGVWELLVPLAARPLFPVNQLSIAKILALLAEPDNHFGANPVSGRNALLLTALDRAVEGLRQRLGSDMSRWQYGQARLKHIRLRHPLSDAVKADVRARLDLEPLPRGGYAHTVNSTSDADNQATGASFRLIADVGDWDRSLGTNTPGQSGDPESPHYQDLYKPWANGEYFPSLFTRARIEAVTEAKTVLVPRRDGP